MIISRLQPIPDTRATFRKNELPICQEDISMLSTTHGEETAETVRFITQVIRMRGGINPRAVECVFPEGRDGQIDQTELIRVVGNIAVWHKDSYLS